MVVKMVMDDSMTGIFLTLGLGELAVCLRHESTFPGQLSDCSFHDTFLPPYTMTISLLTRLIINSQEVDLEKLTGV